jgi:hypothetical protein
LQRQFDIAYMQCMYTRGNQVPGQMARRTVPMQGAPSMSYAPPPRYAPPPNAVAPPPDTPPPQGYAPPGQN